MADDINVAPGQGPTLYALATDELTEINGQDISEAIPRVHAQRVKMVYGPDHLATDVSADAPLPVDTGYPLPPNTVLSGAGPGPVNLPDGAQLHSVLVMPQDSGQVTVTILDQASDALPDGLPYSEDFKGLPVPTGEDVLISGEPAYWRVTFYLPPEV